MLTIAALTAIAALTSGAGASADTLAPGGLSNAPLGSLIQNEPAKIAGLNTAPLGSLILNEPAKVAGLYLAPYLTANGPIARGERLEDRPASAEDPGTVRRAHDEAHELALTLADRDAAEGDFDSALQWLDTLERIDGVLPPGYLAKRAEWMRGAGRAA